MSYEVAKIDSARKYGAKITGLTFDHIRDERTAADLRQLWVDHGLILFKGDTSIPFQIELSRVFGPLTSHPAKELIVEGHPELFLVRHDPKKDPWVYQIGDKAVGAWNPWHFDLAFVPHASRGALLRSVTLPSEGGQTGFVDGIEAYEKLPQHLKAKIDDAEVVYKIEADWAEQPYVARSARAPVKMLRSNHYVSSMKSRQEKDFPAVLHKAVMRHPITGEKMLHVSPQMAVRIHGMDPVESHDVLGAIVDHVSDPGLAYFHEWSPEDMLLWDNWRMIHTAVGIPEGETREMQRTTIASDVTIGRFLSDAEAAAA